MSPPINFSDYIPEADVIARWPMLTAKELRKARKNHLIEFYGFRDGPCYTAEQVQSYIDRTYLKAASCVAPSLQPSPHPAAPQDPSPPLPQMNPSRLVETKPRNSSAV